MAISADLVSVQILTGRHRHVRGIDPQNYSNYPRDTGVIGVDYEKGSGQYRFLYDMTTFDL